MISRAKRTIFDLAGRVASCDVRDTIVLAGASRSGTTWLLEIFRTLPGYKALQEPLMHDEVREQSGLSWRPHIVPNAHRPRQRAYLEKILTGQLELPVAWFFEACSQPMQLLEHLSRRKLVIKFCRAGRMLQWQCRQFEMRGTVLIIRHPCAVVASMLRHGAWEGVKQNEGKWGQAFQNHDIPEPLREQVFSTLEHVNSRVEVLTLTWCLDYYVPFHLHSEAGYPWVLTAYERLVAEGIRELERIAAALDVEVTPTMRAQFDVPSSSVRDRPRQNAQDQLSKWKDRLAPKQVDDILRIVDDFDLGFYTDALHPDYDRLMQFQRDEVETNISTHAA